LLAECAKFVMMMMVYENEMIGGELRILCVDIAKYKRRIRMMESITVITLLLYALNQVNLQEGF
jgi:hypothetical protein